LNNKVLKLIGIHGPFKGHSFDIREGLTTIGRSPDNNICMPNDSLISRMHCQIIYQHGQFIIEDLGSTNGVLLNNEDIESSAVFKVKDHLTIGKTVFEIQDLGVSTQSIQRDKLAKTRFDLDKKVDSPDFISTETCRLDTWQSKELKNAFKLFFTKKK